MNKQEAIEEIKRTDTLTIIDHIGRQELEMVNKNNVLDIISQIHEPQKVTIPKFVAEWIEKHKEDGSRLSHALEKVFDDAEVSLYIKQQEDDYTETIAKAWLAYPNITVEADKLYTVEIPDPHGIYKIRYLFRNSEGNVRIGGSDFRDIFLSAETHLTEAEIKQDFEWAWQWAKEVEDWVGQY